tara:strand:+ start:1785 stop:1997 length:213 start_codon:yes stop_codon:yes gene_type:complete
MQVGNLVMKRDGLIEGSPHYLRLGIIIDKRRTVVHPDGTEDNPVYRVRWADDYGTFWTGEHSLRKVEKPV